MDPLNLDVQEPEEYIGKSVTLFGDEYIVGEYLGSGMQSIVHKLINPKSQLCLHVIKILRDEQTRELMAESEKNILRELKKGLRRRFGDVIPPSFLLETPEGIFQIQNYSGNPEDQSSPTRKTTELADKAIEASEFEKAISLYEEVLRVNPNHTIALNNLAHAYAHTGDLESALASIMQAYVIEPNYLMYLRHAISINLQTGGIRTASRLFEEIKFKFMQHLDPSDFETGIRIDLALGEPEAAAQLFEERKNFIRKPMKADRKLEKNIQTELRDYAEAQKIVASIDHRLESGSITDEELLPLLEEVNQIYPKNILWKLNYALTMQSVGSFDKSVRLLMETVLLAPEHLAPVSYLHLAAAEAYTNNTDQALFWLEFLSESVSIYPGNNQLFLELPFFTQWIFPDSKVEYPPESTIDFLNELSEQYSEETDRPKHLFSLRELYQTALSQYKDQHN